MSAGIHATVVADSRDGAETATGIATVVAGSGNLNKGGLKRSPLEIIVAAGTKKTSGYKKRRKLACNLIYAL